MRFFRKIRNFPLFLAKANSRLILWVEKSEKSDFTVKTSTNFQLFSLQLIVQTTNYCRKHRKFTKFIILHNRTQISEKFSPIVSKIGIFSSATSIVQYTKCKLLTHKILKAAINCSHIYCEEDYGKVLQTCTSLFKDHYCSNWC